MKSYKKLTAAMLVLMAAVSTLRCDEYVVSNEPSTKGPVYSMSDEPEVTVPIPDAPDGYQLIGRLMTPGGQRQLLLKVNGVETPLTSVGWWLPPVGAMAISGNQTTSGGILVCWNELTGAEPGVDQMPSPRDGLRLLCRYRDPAGNIGETMIASHTEHPTWLRSVGVLQADGSFVVDILVDAKGTLFGTPQAGDGWYAGTFDGHTMTTPTPVQVY